MPAFESRRVRTQPLTVTCSSLGARPAKIPRTLNSFLSIDRELSRSFPSKRLAEAQRACPALAKGDGRQSATIVRWHALPRLRRRAPSEERHVRLPALRYQRPGADALGSQGRRFGRAR